MSNGRGNEPLWFHPRACTIPSRTKHSKTVFMTAQGISGSDYFHPVHWMASDDLGKSWSTPEQIPGFGRRDVPGKEYQEGVCDVVPQYHPAEGRVVAMGHSVFYREGRFFLPQPTRSPVYSVYDPVDGSWLGPKSLEWDRSASLSIFSSGCAQRFILEDGTMIIPLTFRERGEEAARVTTALARFDGATVTIEKTGTELALDVERGLLEPTITRHRGRFHLSIRAEDGRGYHSSSDDGVAWEPIEAWSWDDGEPLDMSTTQSRWLPHSNELYLVYVRRAEENRNVMRWRAPLYVARVDTKTMRLERETERVAVALVGDGVNNPDHVARIGNFHTVAVSEYESWVTVGECIPAEDWKGDTIISRIRWTEPNNDS